MMAFNSLELWIIAPELFLCLSAIALLMLGAYGGNKAAGWVMGSSLVILLAVLYLVAFSYTDTPLHFRNAYLTDSFTAYAKSLVLLASIFSLVLAYDWYKREEFRKFEYPVLVLFAALGMMVMISSTSMLSLYMGLELMSLSLYVLAAFDRDNLASSESGLKYFVLGSLASGMLLFGISMVYGFTGSIQFNEIAAAIAASQSTENGNPGMVSHGIIIGMVLILVAFCFKISAAPFHMWTPDVYQGAPTPVTAFFAMAPKVAAICLLMRVLLSPFGAVPEMWTQVIIFAAVLSMLIGAFGALRQENIKRLLAYSSIGHVGYVLVGIVTGTQQGAAAVMLYLAIYIFMTAGVFGCILLVQRKGVFIEQLDDFKGIAAHHPFFAYTLSFILFSLAGIPPFAGFFGKFAVFGAAMKAGYVGLAIIGVLTSVVACYYYIKVVKLMFFDEGELVFQVRPHSIVKLVMVACLLFMLIFPFKPSLITAPAQAAVQTLFP